MLEIIISQAENFLTFFLGFGRFQAGFLIKVFLIKKRVCYQVVISDLFIGMGLLMQNESENQNATCLKMTGKYPIRTN